MHSLRIPLIAVMASVMIPASAGAELRRTAAQVTTDYIASARKVMMTNPTKAYEIGVDMESWAMKNAQGNTRLIGLSRAKWMQGEASLRLSKVGDARRHIEEAYALALKAGDTQAQGDTILSRGALRIETGDPAGAQMDLLKAYRLFRISKDRRSQALALIYLSDLNTDASNYERAWKYVVQAAETYKEDPQVQLSMANSMANLLKNLGHNTEAEREFRRASALASSSGSYTLQLQVLANLCRNQISRHDMKAASETMSDLKYIARRHSLPITDSILIVMGLYAEARGDITEAREMIVKAISYGQPKKDTQSYRDLHEAAYSIFRRAGDEREALHHLEIAKRLKDEAMALSISTKTAMISAEFDYANQELKISNLRARDLRRSVGDARDTARLQRTIFVAAGIATLIIIAILMTGLELLRRSRNNTRRMNGKLEDANHALEKAMVEVKETQIAERQATQLAERDALTGLHNRRHLYATLYEQATRSNADDSSCCVLLLDLDRFKPINDIHGHEVGDAVLIEASRRISAICSEFDAIPIRLGGDEFVILMKGVDADDVSIEIAKRVISEISAPYEIADRRLMIGTSVGISNDARDGKDIDTLLRAADIAMYEAKRTGRGRYRFFDGEMVVRIKNRSEMESDLRTALKNSQIHAYFQPIHSYDENRITGFEALARWTHPDRGPVGPDQFIPVAEETGMIDEVTTTMLRQSCRAGRDWPRDISVSVNLSPILLKDAAIADRIIAILEEEEFSPDRLIIEITENAVIDDLAFASNIIDAFRAAGIRVALDDFGKGYSSLSHLNQLAFDHLKLDASFVRSLGDGDNMKITTAVAGLANAMGMPVTAEGVETAEVARQLRNLGFSYAQGYLYGRAITKDQATALIMNENLETMVGQAA